MMMTDKMNENKPPPLIIKQIKIKNDNKEKKKPVDGQNLLNLY